MTTFLRALPAAIALLIPVTSAEFTFENKPDEGRVDVLEDGRILGRYMYAHDPENRHHETYKPYLHLFDAEGEKPVTKGPGGEFTHHRGLFLGWSKIEVGGKSYDRWHMKGGDQVHQEFSDTEAGDDQAGFTSHISWFGDGDDPILEEQRRMTFMEAPKPAYLMVDFHSTVEAVAGDTGLGGDPEHAGLQFRPANEVDRGKTRYLFPKENADPKKDRDYPWVAQTFVLDGKTYQAIYLNHPDNPQDTVFSAYRDYGRFGAFFRDELDEGDELTLQIRLILVAGDRPDADWIQEQHNIYTGKDAPTPEVTEK